MYSSASTAVELDAPRDAGVSKPHGDAHEEVLRRLDHATRASGGAAGSGRRPCAGRSTRAGRCAVLDRVH